jgi:hypothetical protein
MEPTRGVAAGQSKLELLIIGGGNSLEKQISEGQKMVRV